MQYSQKSCKQEEAPALMVGRELQEEELATIYGGQGGAGEVSTSPSTNSNALGGLGELLNGGMLGNLASSNNTSNGLSPLTTLLKNALPGLGGLSNLSQLLAGLGL